MIYEKKMMKSIAENGEQQIADEIVNFQKENGKEVSRFHLRLTS